MNTPRKQRATHPKVKSGCLTCRIRHVKCDEAKPLCNRCVQYGRICDGYRSEAEQKRGREKVRGNLVQEKKLLPKTDYVASAFDVWNNSTSYPRITIQPSSGLAFQNDLESSYFHVFQVETSHELSGYFESDIWDRIVLQICHREAYARHAVIAIGALHKSLQTAECNSSKSLVPTGQLHNAGQHYVFALQEYSKALRLMQSFDRQPRDVQIRNMLISTLLTTCFESYIGNQKDAIRQCQAAADILFDLEESGTYLSGEDVSSLSSTASFLNGDLIGTILRLDSLSISFKGTDPAGEKTHIRRPLKTLVLPKMPLTFVNVKEARFYWNVLQHRFLEWKMTQYPKGSAATGLWNLCQMEMPKSVCKEISRCAKATGKWYRAFEPVFKRSQQLSSTSKYHLGARVLMVTYLHWCCVNPPSRIGAPLDILPLHKQIVDLSRSILEIQARNCGPRQPKYMFDESLIVRLFHVAVKCQENASLRREAVSLLWNYPRREGVWDSLMSATIATWVINQEEKSRVDGIIPESARLRIVRTAYFLPEQKVILQCSKMIEGSSCPQERVLLPEVTLTWEINTP